MVYLKRESAPQNIIEIETQEEAELLLHPLQVEDEPYVLATEEEFNASRVQPEGTQLSESEAAGIANAEADMEASKEGETIAQEQSETQS